MKQSLILCAGLLLTACGQVATEKPDEVAVELPEFNTYTEAQLNVLKAFGMPEFDTSIIKSVPLRDGMAVIFGYGGNVLVSVGEDGTIMVDNQFPEIHEALLDEVKKLGGEKVDYVINTHWHFDHAEGNRAFGPLGAEIIAHENSTEYMKNAHDINLVQIVWPQQAYPEAAIPKTSYSDTLDLLLNGQEITLYNFGPAHTTGDSQVYFKTANIIHMGDVGNFTPNPFIDVDNGGDIDGMISTVRAVIEMIDDETIIVPGHGEIGNKETLIKYAESLENTRANIGTLKSEGKTVGEVQAAYQQGDLAGTASPLLVDRAYHSID